MYKKIRLFILKTHILFFALIFLSCKTVPKFSDEAKICGLIIDEDNQPIDGGLVVVKKGGVRKHAYTNNRGIFVIEDIQSGIYDFIFEKNGYEITSKENVLFSDRNKFFCFQINSKEKLFEQIDSHFNNQQYEKGISVIGSIKTEKDSKLYNLCCLYKSYGYYRMNDLKAAKLELERVKKKKNCSFDFSAFEKKLEGK